MRILAYFIRRVKHQFKTANYENIQDCKTSKSDFSNPCRLKNQNIYIIRQIISFLQFGNIINRVVCVFNITIF